MQIEAASALAEVVQRPLYLWWTSLFRCARAQLAGDFEAAERLAAETLAIGQRGHAENALHCYAMALFNIRREQGRLGEVEDAVAGFVEMYPAVPAWRCTQALGRWDEAERRFADARKMHVRMGARPWLARTELAWAEMLLARGGPGDDRAARERLAEGIVIADALGMVAVAEHARALVAGGGAVRTRA